jgi:hypothetical protein
MATIFLRHPVADYKEWRPYYDGDIERRNKAGLKEIAVFQNAKDPNDVLIEFSARDRSGIDEMLSSSGLKAKMEEAGVTAPPQAFVVE